MYKKGIASLLAISVLSLGVTGAAFAAQTNNLSADPNQSVETLAPAKIVDAQKANTTVLQLKIGSKAQGQAGIVTSAQLLGGKTSGPATWTQTSQTKLSLKDKQGNKEQSTKVESDIAQGTTTEVPTQTVQAQIDHTSAMQFQISIPGGPTIQNQMAQQTSVQHLNAMSWPSK